MRLCKHGKSALLLNCCCSVMLSSFCFFVEFWYDVCNVFFCCVAERVLVLLCFRGSSSKCMGQHSNLSPRRQTSKDMELSTKVYWCTSPEVTCRWQGWTCYGEYSEALEPRLTHSCQSLSRLSRGRDASPSQVTPLQFVRFSPTICQYPFIHLGGERHCESKVSCPRTQHNVLCQWVHFLFLKKLMFSYM